MHERTGNSKEACPSFRKDDHDDDDDGPDSAIPKKLVGFLGSIDDDDGDPAISRKRARVSGSKYDESSPSDCNNDHSSSSSSTVASCPARRQQRRQKQRLVLELRQKRRNVNDGGGGNSAELLHTPLLPLATTISDDPCKKAAEDNEYLETIQKLMMTVDDDDDGGGYQLNDDRVEEWDLPREPDPWIKANNERLLDAAYAQASDPNAPLWISSRSTRSVTRYDNNIPALPRNIFRPYSIFEAALERVHRAWPDDMNFAEDICNRPLFWAAYAIDFVLMLKDRFYGCAWYVGITGRVHWRATNLSCGNLHKYEAMFLILKSLSAKLNRDVELIIIQLVGGKLRNDVIHDLQGLLRHRPNFAKRFVNCYTCDNKGEQEGWVGGSPHFLYICIRGMYGGGGGLIRKNPHYPT